ncbi:Amidohydrolase [Burkholderiales bacterium 8X]|nr:Amidohydrolase [Burkholderiales bacterium 8X]
MKLQAVHIPPGLRGDDLPVGVSGAVDIVIEDGKVGKVLPSDASPRGVLLSAPVDLHTHIDKNYCVHEVGAAEGDLFAAIRRMAVYNQNLAAHLRVERMARALEEVWQFGTRALRTHIDWGEPEAPPALAAACRLREQWHGRIDLQIVALTPLDVFAESEAAERIGEQVAAAGAVLGAFVYRNDDLHAKLDRVFAAAKRHGSMLDFHVDEGLDADARGLEAIAELTLCHGLEGRVVCGHACSLGIQPAGDAANTIRLCAEAGIHLVALPTTNLYLQGAWDGTPVQRGITRMREARAAGIGMSVATDNVQDGFYPYGSYDLIETFSLGVQVAHLAPAMNWLEAITVAPARAMGLVWDGRIAPGCPADLLLLSATADHELLTPAGRSRTVIRSGRALTPLPPAQV